MEKNLRGAYVALAHDRKEDWDFLAAWQPSVIRVMVHGSHSDPNSVSLDKIVRLHHVCPDALLLLRCWDVDDRNFEAHQAMVANPNKEAEKQLEWWARLFDRIKEVPRTQLMAGLNNEVHPSHAVPLVGYTAQAMRVGKQWGVRLGVGVFSTGTPALPGEAEYDIEEYAYYWRGLILDGDHALLLHEYLQPEGRLAVWTDERGQKREDYGFLIGRHKHWPTDIPIIIGEWGIEGILYNRHRDPHYGNAGWLNFPELWPPERYADEYVACVQEAGSNVLAICPFLTDYADRRWASFDTLPAHRALLERKHLCVRPVPTQRNTTYIPAVLRSEAKEPRGSRGVPMSNIIEPKVAQAILMVESGGRTHGADGRIIIRFEPHIFRQYVSPETFARHFQVGNPAWYGEYHRFRTDVDQPWQSFHGNQAKEYEAFELAFAIDREAACRSISMGVGQVMGFNHARVGYPSAYAMYQSLQNAPMQVVAFLNYFLSDDELREAMYQRDWHTIAYKYNGSGQVEKYSKLLQNAYNNL